MRPSTLALGLALAGAAGSWGCQYCVDGPRSSAVSDQPLGAHCGGVADCAVGLACIDDLCSVSCAGDPSACPPGSGCIFGYLCLPPCASDDDCLLGATVGRCTGPPAADPPYCFPVGCDRDDDCPPGGRCVDASEARGITWNDSCATGYCQR